MVPSIFDWTHPSFEVEIPQTVDQVFRSNEISKMVQLLIDQGYPDPYTLLIGDKKFTVYRSGRIEEEK